MECSKFKKDTAAQARASQVKQSLINQGIQEPQLSMAMAQAAHESDYFNSGLAKDDNNYSGITWRKSITSYGPSTSHKIPGGEPGTGIPYGHFDNTDQWAAAFKKNLAKDRGHGSPLASDNITDWATKLGGIRDANGKAISNAYYTAPIGQYITAMISAKNCIGGVVANGNAAPVNTAATVENQNFLKENEQTDFKSNLDAIEANVDGLTADNVNVSWGARQNSTETSDWIGLRQYLMYLSMTYEPQSLVPFIELIPKFFIDGSESAGLWSKIVLNKQLDNGTDMGLVSQKEALNFLKMKDKFNNLQGQGNNQGIDLLTTDPFQEGVAFGKASRNLGYRVFGAVVLNPEIKGNESSKAGAIGFKSLEISQGAQVQQGLTLITIKILDVQGNKFLDVTSPWSFLLNAFQINGDFYFRYGWQIKVPKYDTNEKNKATQSWKFWNHPGWKIFGNGDESSVTKLKEEIYSLARVGGDQLTLTQSPNKASICNPGYSEQGSQNKDGTQSSVFVINRDIINSELMLRDYLIISMINPELSINSEDGSMTATIQFYMNSAMANVMCPLSQAFKLHQMVSDAENGTVTLSKMMKLFLEDGAVYTAGNPRLKNYKKYEIDGTQPIKSWLTLKKMSDMTIVDPESIDKIVIKENRKNEINTNYKSATCTVFTRAWITDVLSDNGLNLVSSCDPASTTINNSSGFNILWDDNHHSEISSKNITSANIQDNDAGTAFLGNSKIDRIVLQDDVFSFRFKGSLVEEFNIENNENSGTGQQTDNQQRYAQGILGNNKIEGGGVDNNKTGTYNGAEKAANSDKITINDKKRNLWYQLSKISAATIKCICHPWLKIASTIYVKGTGYFDGKYVVSKIKHTLNDSNKFETEINAVRIMQDQDYNNKQKELRNDQFSNMMQPGKQFAAPARLPAQDNLGNQNIQANLANRIKFNQIKPKVKEVKNTDASLRINEFMGGNILGF